METLNAQPEAVKNTDETLADKARNVANDVVEHIDPMITNFLKKLAPLFPQIKQNMAMWEKAQAKPEYISIDRGIAMLRDSINDYQQRIYKAKRNNNSSDIGWYKAQIESNKKRLENLLEWKYKYNTKRVDWAKDVLGF